MQKLKQDHGAVKEGIAPRQEADKHLDEASPNLHKMVENR